MHHFFRNIASATMYIFTGAYFLKLGMPLHYVLLFYGLEFGLRGLMCPFGLVCMSKLGLLRSQFISVIFLILFFVGISFSDHSIWIGFFSLILASISGGIYYPFADIIEAFYIEEDHNRAKQISLGIILSSLGRIFGATVVGFLLANFGGFDAVLLFVIISLILSVLPLYGLNEKTESFSYKRSSEVFRILSDEDFKPMWKPFLGEQLTIIVKSVMVPIFIYTVVGEFDDLGYLIAFSLIAEKVLTLAAGHYTDKWGAKRTIKKSMVAYWCSMGFYALFAKTPLSVFFAESFHKTVSNVYSSAFRSSMHMYAREKYPGRVLLFGSGWQMALCFGELFVLPLYGLLAYFIGTDVFYVSFVFAALGMAVVYDYCRKALKD